MTEKTKLEILKAILYGDLGTAREIEESINILTDESKPVWNRKKYYYDDNGNEYHYDINGKRHYTKMEG